MNQIRIQMNEIGASAIRAGAHGRSRLMQIYRLRGLGHG
jgi:hypothetical protein